MDRDGGLEGSNELSSQRPVSDRVEVSAGVHDFHNLLRLSIRKISLERQGCDIRVTLLSSADYHCRVGTALTMIV